MANENLLPFDPNKVPDLIRQGEIRVVSTPTLPSPEPAVVPTSRAVERAKQLFGEDFLGEEAIHLMEQKCQAAGINVKFEIPQSVLDNAILEEAKRDETKGRARLVVLRPESMTVDGERKSVTLVNLRDLFKDKNPFGQGKIFYDENWYDDQDFAKEPMKAGYGMPTKEVLTNPLISTWNMQQKLLEAGEKRREAVETAWDILLYYANTGKRSLVNYFDWGESLASTDNHVAVGSFDSNGLRVRKWVTEHTFEFIGVCPSR